MESDENRFVAVIKSIFNSKQRASQQVRSSSTPGMMIPTPGMQQNRNAQSIISGSVENHKISSSSVECSPATNAGNLQPTGNGQTDVNASFHLANGNLICVFHLFYLSFAPLWFHVYWDETFSSVQFPIAIRDKVLTFLLVQV